MQYKYIAGFSLRKPLRILLREAIDFYSNPRHVDVFIGAIRWIDQ